MEGDKFVGVNFTVIKDESRWEIAVGGRLYRCPNGSNILDISLDLLSGPAVALYGAVERVLQDIWDCAGLVHQFAAGQGVILELGGVG